MKNDHYDYLRLLGKRIRTKRLMLEMKQDTLAKAIGITQVEISLIENGKYCCLKHTTILDINTVLQIPSGDLFTPP